MKEGPRLAIYRQSLSVVLKISEVSKTVEKESDIHALV